MSIQYLPDSVLVGAATFLSLLLSGIVTVWFTKMALGIRKGFIKGMSDAIKQRVEEFFEVRLPPTHKADGHSPSQMGAGLQNALDKGASGNEGKGGGNSGLAAAAGGLAGGLAGAAAAGGFSGTGDDSDSAIHDSGADMADGAAAANDGAAVANDGAPAVGDMAGSSDSGTNDEPNATDGNDSGEKGEEDEGKEVANQDSLADNDDNDTDESDADDADDAEDGKNGPAGPAGKDGTDDNHLAADGAAGQSGQSVMAEGDQGINGSKGNDGMNPSAPPQLSVIKGNKSPVPETASASKSGNKPGDKTGSATPTSDKSGDSKQSNQGETSDAKKDPAAAAAAEAQKLKSVKAAQEASKGKSGNGQDKKKKKNAGLSKSTTKSNKPTKKQQADALRMQAAGAKGMAAQQRAMANTADNNAKQHENAAEIMRDGAAAYSNDAKMHENQAAMARNGANAYDNRANAEMGNAQLAMGGVQYNVGMAQLEAAKGQFGMGQAGYEASRANAQYTDAMGREMEAGNHSAAADAAAERQQRDEHAANDASMAALGDKHRAEAMDERAREERKQARYDKADAADARRHAVEDDIQAQMFGSGQLGDTAGARKATIAAKKSMQGAKNASNEVGRAKEMQGAHEKQADMYRGKAERHANTANSEQHKAELASEAAKTARGNAQKLESQSADTAGMAQKTLAGADGYAERASTSFAASLDHQSRAGVYADSANMMRGESNRQYMAANASRYTANGMLAGATNQRMAANQSYNQANMYENNAATAETAGNYMSTAASSVASSRGRSGNSSYNTYVAAQQTFGNMMSQGVVDPRQLGAGQMSASQAGQPNINRRANVNRTGGTNGGTIEMQDNVTFNNRGQQGSQTIANQHVVDVQQTGGVSQRGTTSRSVAAAGTSAQPVNMPAANIGTANINNANINNANIRHINTGTQGQPQTGKTVEVKENVTYQNQGGAGTQRVDNNVVVTGGNQQNAPQSTSRTVQGRTNGTPVVPVGNTPNVPTGNVGQPTVQHTSGTQGQPQTGKTVEVRDNVTYQNQGGAGTQRVDNNVVVTGGNQQNAPQSTSRTVQGRTNGTPVVPVGNTPNVPTGNVGQPTVQHTSSTQGQPQTGRTVEVRDNVTYQNQGGAGTQRVDNNVVVTGGNQQNAPQSTSRTVQGRANGTPVVPVGNTPNVPTGNVGQPTVRHTSGTQGQPQTGRTVEVRDNVTYQNQGGAGTQRVDNNVVVTGGNQQNAPQSTSRTVQGRANGTPVAPMNGAPVVPTGNASVQPTVHRTTNVQGQPAQNGGTVEVRDTVTYQNQGGSAGTQYVENKTVVTGGGSVNQTPQSTSRTVQGRANGTPVAPMNGTPVVPTGNASVQPTVHRTTNVQGQSAQNGGTVEVRDTVTYQNQGSSAGTQYVENKTVVTGGGSVNQTPQSTSRTVQGRSNGAPVAPMNGAPVVPTGNASVQPTVHRTTNVQGQPAQNGGTVEVRDTVTYQNQGGSAGTQYVENKTVVTGGGSVNQTHQGTTRTAQGRNGGGRTVTPVNGTSVVPEGNASVQPTVHRTSSVQGKPSQGGGTVEVRDNVTYQNQGTQGTRYIDNNTIVNEQSSGGNWGAGRHTSHTSIGPTYVGDTGASVDEVADMKSNSNPPSSNGRRGRK